MIGTRPDLVGRRILPYRWTLVAFSLALMGPGAMAQDALVMRSRSVSVDYVVNPEARPISEVTVWSTEDRGASWKVLARDVDLRSPAEVELPGDGLFGLFVVVGNATGFSSQPPTGGTQPQQWIFVDATPPVVQLHALTQTDSGVGPVVQVRWTAMDSYLPTRPIDIQYRSDGQSEWQHAAPDPLPNTGRFDWQVPSTAAKLTVRLVVHDRGGNRTTTEPQTLTIDREQPASPRQQTASRPVAPWKSISAQGHPGGYYAEAPSRTAAMGTAARAPVTNELPKPLAAADQADRLIKEAGRLYDNGDLSQAVARLRQAVELDPDRTDAFAELGGMLYRLGENEHALGAYDIVLRRNPDSRTALLGSAAVLSHQRDYASAVRRLRTLLRYEPTDAEAWMNLGDVAVYQGDESLARECYTRATQIDASAKTIIADAQKRLDLMKQVSRTYQTGTKPGAARATQGN